MTKCCQCEIIPPIGEVGKMLYHFTTLEAAIKIIATGELRFSKLENMNDIAESSLTIFSLHFDDSSIVNELKTYKILSFTTDSHHSRGYEIDTMWGYYGEYGNGVCLVFDKQRLIQSLKHQFKGTCSYGRVLYHKRTTRARFLMDDKKDTIGTCNKELWHNRKDLFFQKAADWKHEQEYRFLITGDALKVDTIKFEESLVATIVCSPKFQGENVKLSPTYKVMASMTNHPPLFCYQQNLGNKELYCYECTEPHNVDQKWRLKI